MCPRTSVRSWIELFVGFICITITKFQITVLLFYKLWQLSSQPLMNAQDLQARKWLHGSILFLSNVLPAFKRQGTQLWSNHWISICMNSRHHCQAHQLFSCCQKTRLNSHSLLPSLHPHLHRMQQTSNRFNFSSYFSSRNFNCYSFPTYIWFYFSVIDKTFPKAVKFSCKSNILYTCLV